MVKLKIALVLMGILLVQASQDVMKEITKTFAKPMEVCRKELELSDSVVKDFVNFWRSDYQLADKQTGCALICLSSKLDLLDESLGLHHGNAKEFAKKHGADDATAQKLLDMIHNCSQKFINVADDCDKTLNAVNCFKTEIHQLNWAPDMEVLMAEVLAA